MVLNNLSSLKTCVWFAIGSAFVLWRVHVHASKSSPPTERHDDDEVCLAEQKQMNQNHESLSSDSSADCSKRRPRQERRRTMNTTTLLPPQNEGKASHMVVTTEIAIIGEVRSGFENKRGVPRQGSLAPSIKANVVLFPHLVSSDALIGLSDFSHVWIVFLFSRNSNTTEVNRWRSRDKNLFKSKVRPPLLGGKKVGVFSTRSPHRPNPVGMTLARIELVDVVKGELTVSGIDLCDHTPVIDLKPFVPADQVTNPVFASWVLAPKPYTVVFSTNSENGLRTVGGGRKHHHDVDALQQAIRDVLALDVRGIGQRRGAVEPGVMHRIVVDGVEVSFSFESDRQVIVHMVSSSTTSLET